jgi:hypothetical protein
MGDRADLHFRAGWTETLTGVLAQGGQLHVTYDSARLPQCRRNWRGAEIGRIELAGCFHPGGSIFTEPRGTTLDVPLGAERLELWFRTFLSIAVGLPCEAWDSRFGANYWYDIAPRGPAQPVRYRLDATPSLAMVNVLAAEVDRTWVPARAATRESAGAEVRTTLSLVVWGPKCSVSKERLGRCPRLWTFRRTDSLRNLHVVLPGPGGRERRRIRARRGGGPPELGRIRPGRLAPA